MKDLTRAELIAKLVEMSGATERDVTEYLRKGDDYVDTLPDDITQIDGEEQLDYIYQNSDLDPNVIEKISEAEFELLFGEE